MPEGAARTRVASYRLSQLHPKCSQRLIRRLWLRWAREPSDAIAWHLARCHAPLLRRHAVCPSNRLSASVDLDELESCGPLGRLDAIAACNFALGVKFETFIAMRMRGAMLDESRQADWVPRSVRASQRKFEAAPSAAQAQPPRPPGDLEPMERLDPDPVKAAHILGEGRVAGVMPMGDENRAATGTTGRTALVPRLTPEPPTPRGGRCGRS